MVMTGDQMFVVLAVKSRHLIFLQATCSIVQLVMGEECRLAQV